MSGLVAGLIALPLLAATLVTIASRHISPSNAHRIALTVTSVTALCALSLLLRVDSSLIAIEWLPGAGLMRLTTGATGLYAVLVTAGGAFLVLLAPSFIPPNDKEGGKGGLQHSPLSAAIMLLALAATNVAFLTDHFLARYIALEVVALCIISALLVEIRTSSGSRLAWNNYLLLRLGDAGLFTAILILNDASRTLSIIPALEAGVSLDTTQLISVVASFILAVWVKLGIWPFHLWIQSGRWLTLTSQAWLYATIMPNLGLYLLYRITPLLVLARPLQTAALWLGAGGAALAALIALTQVDQRATLVYLGAAQGGLALFVAASGVKPAVWLSLLVLTPLRLLLFLTLEVAQRSITAIQHKAAMYLFTLGGLALTAFSLLTTWWARRTGVSLDILFVAEAAVALTGVWVVRMVRQLFRPISRVIKGPTNHWTQWAMVGLLSSGVLTVGLAFRPLAHHMAAASRVPLPTLPTLPALLRYAATAPALLVTMILVLAVWQLQRRSRLRPLFSGQPTDKVYDLEEGLAQAAKVLHAVVEIGIAEQIVALAARAVVYGSRVTLRAIEHKGLEGLLRGLVRAVVDGARITLRAVEHKGLEGLLRGLVRAMVDGARITNRIVEHNSLEGFLQRTVRSVLVISRGLQYRHAGRLRRNLLWVIISLTLAVLALVLY